MANTKNFIAKNGVSTGDGYAMPDVRPSLLLDFANSKTLDPRITFTRGSTATYWDGHTTTKAEENLSTNSQTIANLTQTNITATDNDASAPDGTTTATKIVVNSATNAFHDAYLNAQSTVTGVTYTHSVYAKAGTGVSAVYLYGTIGGTGLIAKFNISTGAYIGNASGDGYDAFDSYAITDVGNGWYRIQATKTETSGASRAFTLGVSNTTTDDVTQYNGNGTNFCHLWGVQIEQRSSATAYTATTSQAIVKYQPTLQTAASGEARFDHDPVTGESKGLLIEEGRTNLNSVSATFNTGAYVATNATKYIDRGISPDGTQSAVQVSANYGQTTPQGMVRNITCNANTTYTSSTYVKMAGYRYLTFWIDNGGGIGRHIQIDGTDGSITNTYSNEGSVFDPNSFSQAVEDVGNGWYRISITYKTLTGISTINHRWYSADTSGSDSFGSGSLSSAASGENGLLVWGVQMEVSAFPTSYTPTSGSTVTRSPDDASFSSSQLDTWFPQLAGDTNSGGSFYFEWDSLGIIGSNDWSCLWRNPNTSARMGVYEQSNGLVYVEVSPSATEANLNTGTAVSGYNRLAASLQHNNCAASLNGSTAVTDTSVRIPDGLTTFYFGWYTTDNSVQSHIKKFAFYPQRLSNATLQAMTEA